MNQKLSIDEKRERIKSNYETIEVLKDRIEKRSEHEKEGISRAAYIKMIFEITKKLDKQTSELNDISAETSLLRKDISSLSGRLDRGLTLAKNNVHKVGNLYWSRECYRLLTLMHISFDELIKAIQETGDVTREIRQLEDQIGHMRATFDR